ncbi:MAG: hypothetical protein WC454_05660 [Phycisphaerae bacterium]
MFGWRGVSNSFIKPTQQKAKNYDSTSREKRPATARGGSRITEMV